MNRINILGEIIEYIEDHLDAAIDIGLLARKCGLSVYGVFSRLPPDFRSASISESAACRVPVKNYCKQTLRSPSLP